jgi:5-hydroxyisourate hydrolase-like protein (transthyretin family)
MRKLVFALSVLLLCLLAVPAATFAQGEGIIEGQVMNGTADAPPDSVAGLEVALYRMSGESGELVTTTVSDGEGRFRFEDLPTDEDIVYVFELEYQDIFYGAQSSFPAGDTILHVVATIHETTSGDDSIAVERHHLIVDFESDAVVLRELYIFDNASDRIYVGQEGATLRFYLPDGAADLSFGDTETAADVIETSEGFAYTRRLPPGQTQILYSYSVPYDGTELTLRRTILYPTANLDLLVANVGVQAETAQLSYSGLTSTGDESYMHFGGTDLPADTTIELRISGGSQGAPVPALPGSSLIVALRQAAPAIAVALAILGALLPFVQLRLGKAAPAITGEGSVPGQEEPATRDADLGAEEDELLRLMADLDDAYAEGLLQEQAYRQLRDKMKSRLRKIGAE